jgi:hypothetical protein
MITIINFAIFLYSTYIQEDWDEYTKFGKKFIYPFWFIRAALIWFFFFLFIPEYVWKKSKMYKKYIKLYNQMLKKQLTRY